MNQIFGVKNMNKNKFSVVSTKSLFYFISSVHQLNPVCMLKVHIS